MTILGGQSEWDDTKEANNLAKHGVSFLETVGAERPALPSVWRASKARGSCPPYRRRRREESLISRRKRER